MSVRTLRFPTRSFRMIERNAMALRHHWMILFSGFVEPVLYLLGIGFWHRFLGADNTFGRRPFRQLCGIRSPRPDGRICDERSHLRVHVQPVLEAPLREDVRRHRLDAGRNRGCDAGRGHLGDRAWQPVFDWLRHLDDRAGVGGVPLGKSLRYRRRSWSALRLPQWAQP